MTHLEKLRLHTLRSSRRERDVRIRPLFLATLEATGREQIGLRDRCRRERGRGELERH
jgi:hypothetical protein